MRITVVHPGNEWILSRLAKEMVNASHGWQDVGLTSWMSDVSQMPEVVYFVDAQCCWTPVSESRMRSCFSGVPAVGFYTHADRDDLSTVRPEIRRLDGVVHMAERYRTAFERQEWYPKERMTVIHPGQPASRFRMRRLRVGVCQRGGFPGKGDPFLFEALTGLSPLYGRHVELRIKGSGWLPSLDHYAAHRGSDFQWTLFKSEVRVCVDEDEAPESYQSFYDGLDLLLVPSLWEGGPMCVQEALACGLPVIAADVGFVPWMLTTAEHQLMPGCDIFLAGNAQELRHLLIGHVHDRMERRGRVQDLSWKFYAEKLEAFARTLMEMRHG